MNKVKIFIKKHKYVIGMSASLGVVGVLAYQIGKREGIKDLAKELIYIYENGGEPLTAINDTTNLMYELKAECIGD